MCPHTARWVPARSCLNISVRVVKGSVLMDWDQLAAQLMMQSCCSPCRNATLLIARRTLPPFGQTAEQTRGEKHIVQVGDAAAKLFKSIFICNVTAQQREPGWVEAVGIICFDLVHFLAR